MIYILFFRNKDIYNTYLDFFMNFQKVTRPFTWIFLLCIGIWLLLHEINRWRHNVFQFGEWHWKRENSNWLLSEIKRERWKIILPSMGLELTTPGLWVQRSTNWAMGEIYNTMENRIVLKIFLQLCYQFVSEQRGCGPSCHLFRALEPT